MSIITSANLANAIVKLVAADALPALMANMVMGNLVNRIYNPWGIGSNGIIQITARDKLINGCFTSAAAAADQTGTATGYA